MKKNFLIKTAEFAKICGTTKETIFYYDKTDLLKPVHVSEKGYRYYALTQSDQFYAIQELRHLGLSLKEIKETVKTDRPEQYFQTLEEIQNKISEKIRNLKQTQKTLSCIQHDFQNYFSGKEYCLEEIGAGFICKTPSAKQAEQTEYIHKFLELSQNAPAFLMNSHFYAGVIKKRQKYFSPFLCEYYYFRQPGTAYKTNFRKQKCLIGFHGEAYENIPQTYEKMFSFAEKNKIRLTDTAYEEILYSSLSSHQENFIVKIMLKTKQPTAGA